MPGAGGAGAGIGGAGANPTIEQRALPTIASPQAPQYDPFDTVYPYTDATVTLLATEHPVWQKVALAIGIRRGALRSTPDQGIPLDRVREATDLTAQKECEDASRLALSDIVTAGDINIVSVVVPLPFTGVWFVNVQNLREDGQPERRLSPTT